MAADSERARERSERLQRYRKEDSANEGDQPSDSEAESEAAGDMAGTEAAAADEAEDTETEAGNT